MCDRRHRRAVLFSGVSHAGVLWSTHGVLARARPRRAGVRASLLCAARAATRGRARPPQRSPAHAGSAAALVRHYWVLTAYSWGTSLGTFRSTVSVRSCFPRRRGVHVSRGAGRSTAATAVHRCVHLGYLRGTHSSGAVELWHARSTRLRVRRRRHQPAHARSDVSRRCVPGAFDAAVYIYVCI